MYKHFSKEENIATRHKIVIVLSKTVCDFLVLKTTKHKSTISLEDSTHLSL